MKQEAKLMERGSNTWSQDSIRMILTPGARAKSIYLYAQELGYFKTLYPYFSERQNLDSFLLVYTLSGRGQLVYEGKEYEVGPGQCFWIHCAKHHLYRTPKGEEWEFLWLHFNGNGSLGYYQEFTRNGFGLLEVKNPEKLKSLLLELMDLYQGRDCTTEVKASHRIYTILTELLLQTATNAADTFLIPEYIREIAREIDKNFKEDLTLDDFARKVHRNKYHVLKEFKKYMGSTIKEYMILARISCAKELLKYSHLTVGEIAQETGVDNVSHFIRLFRAREGMTPLAYRKAWRDLPSQ